MLTNPERVAPDFCTIEVAAGLAKKVRQKLLTPEKAAAALDTLPMIVTGSFDTYALIEPAMRLAVQIDHALYDCFYLALATELDAVVVTSDHKFARCAERAGLGDKVELLTSS